MQKAIDDETSMSVTEYDKFQNKADLVNVVRCKDCKCFSSLNIFGDNLHGYCFEKTFGAGSKKIMLDDYCSYGQRKDEA